MELGRRIKEARKKLNMTQEQLGAKSGVAAITVRQYEAGKRQPRLDAVQTIANVLGVDPNWLLTGVDLEQQMRKFIGGDSTWATREIIRGPHTRIDAALDKLNQEGQEKAAERVEELSEIPKYRRQSPQNNTDAIEDKE